MLTSGVFVKISVDKPASIIIVTRFWIQHKIHKKYIRNENMRFILLR